jgi:hypothetical protein
VAGTDVWKFEASSPVSSHRAGAQFKQLGCQANLKHDRKQILAHQNLKNILRQEIKTRHFLGY